MAWTSERVETVKRMWIDGYSAGRIAEELNCGLSRNAVIGKVTRLGLPLRNGNNRSIYCRPNRYENRKDAKPRKAKLASTGWHARRIQGVAPLIAKEPIPETPIVDTEIPVEQRRTILTLTEKACKWPIGDPQDKSFFFCGGKSLTGYPYCAEHSRRAWSVAPRRPKPRVSRFPLVGR